MNKRVTSPIPFYSHRKIRLEVFLFSFSSSVFPCSAFSSKFFHWVKAHTIKFGLLMFTDHIWHGIPNKGITSDMGFPSLFATHTSHPILNRDIWTILKLPLHSDEAAKAGRYRRFVGPLKLQIWAQAWHSWTWAIFKSCKYQNSVARSDSRFTQHCQNEMATAIPHPMESDMQNCGLIARVPSTLLSPISKLQTVVGLV